jgi:hypothetical protein
MPSSTLTQLLLFIPFILVIYTCSYMIYLYLCLCHAFALIYLLCYGVYPLLWICATPPVVVELSILCVFMFFVYGLSLRASQGDCTSLEHLCHGFALPWL